jgi:hypothetical protein
LIEEVAGEPPEPFVGPVALLDESLLPELPDELFIALLLLHAGDMPPLLEPVPVCWALAPCTLAASPSPRAAAIAADRNLSMRKVPSEAFEIQRSSPGRVEKNKPARRV